MDRRKLKSRRGLHQNFMGLLPSTSAAPSPVPESEDMFSSPYRSSSSQRKSKLELICQLTQSPALVHKDENPKEDDRSQTKRKQSQRPTSGSPAKMSRRERSTSRLVRLTSQVSERDSQPRRDGGSFQTAKSPPRAAEKPSNRTQNSLTHAKLPRTESDKKNGSSRSSHMEIEDDTSEDEPPPAREKSLLEKFFERSGIRRSPENDEQYITTTNPAGIVKKIQQVLSSGNFSKGNVLREWEGSLQEIENIKKYLNPTIIENDQRLLSSASSVSVARILLQVPLIQTEIISSLLQRLNEEVLVADSLEEVPWACALLPQLRFLEVVTDANALTIKLEELLESSPIWFQRELIANLPDIVTDSHHQSIADVLCKLMESNTQLKQVILDCITSLTLGKEYLEELREKVLLILQNTSDISEVPAMVKFCLHDCPTLEVCQKVLKIIRELELQPLRQSDLEECYTSQMMTVNALKLSIIMTKLTSKAALAILSEPTDNAPKTLDLIILLLLCGEGSKRKVAEGIFRKHVKTGYYRSSLLSQFYRDFKEVAKDLQATCLNLASNLLKSEDCMLVDFSIEWLRGQFLCHSKLPHRQSEIIGKLILLMGNNDQTAKHALAVLCKMTKKKEEKQELQKHSSDLTVLMEKIDKFDLEEVATMNDLLYALCSTSRSEALREDLFILLQKQLTHTDTVIKCKGVVGAVMAIKHLTKDEKSCGTAREILRKVEKTTQDCPRAQALFYDKMGQIIATSETMNEEFINSLVVSFEDQLANNYMTDTGTMGDLVPKFGLNEQQDMMVYFGETKYGAIVPALFRVVRICYMRITKDLEPVSAVLGCAIMMPQDMDVPEPRVLDLIFHCVNWHRELISAYITQSDNLMKTQVVQRLDNLMNLQGELSTLLALGEPRYQPPPCYFHKHPPPPFNRVEKKIGRKSGKKKDADRSNNVPEWECWENGSLMTIKNPMYFRRLDATIVHFLDTDVSRELFSGHVCFIVKELLSMLEDDTYANHEFIRDLVKLLPKICARLNHLVNELRQDANNHNKQAAKLIFELLSKIFSWKGFSSPSHHSMLREGLRVIASQTNESNATLRSSCELVAECYAYFESLTDIVTQIAVAHALVNVCKTLMKHSDTYTRQNKDKQAKMSYGFLSVEWQDDRHMGSSYNAAVTGLLRNWMDYEPDPLEAVSLAVEWLPEEVEKMEKPQDKLTRLPTINKANFHYLFQKLLDGLIRGAKIALSTAEGDAAKLRVWKTIGQNLQQLVKVSKAIRTRGTLLTYLRQMPHLVKLLISAGMPVLEHNLRYHPEEVTGILKMMQGGTRYLNAVCCHSTERKDMALTKLIPAAKEILEQLVYSVKGMLVLNNSSTAFWMGNLVNKNLDGQEILSQSSMATEDTIPDVNVDHHSDGEESTSDILGDDEDTNDANNYSVGS